MAARRNDEQWTQRETRNVIIVGKTGSGKSSLGNHVLKSKKFVISDSALASTAADIVHGEVQGTVNGVEYLVKVVDTVGLYDTRKLENGKAMDRIKRYVDQHLSDGVSLILFVFKKGRYTEEEKKTFEFINKRFGSDIKAISALVITHCENDDKRSREGLIQDFKSNELTKEIAEAMGRGIITVGFPDIDKILEVLREVFRNLIEKDESKLSQLVLESRDKVVIKQSFWERCQIL